MQIIIKTLTGKCQSLNFEPTNTIADVKDVLRERECENSLYFYNSVGIDPGQIRLIYSGIHRATIIHSTRYIMCNLGKQMSDELTLNDYKVVPGSTIHMVLQLRGG